MLCTPDYHRKASSKQQTDILFCFCPYAGHPPPHRFDITLGAAYLGSYLKEHGINASFFYGRYDNDPGFGQILEFVQTTKPRSVGFTIYGSNLPETTALSRAIKHTYPELPIIWGGPEIRYKPEQIIDRYRQYVDVCIAGEGEKPLLRLMTHTTPWSDEFLASIPGVCFLGKKDGKIIQSIPGSTVLQDNAGHLDPQSALDTYPSPYLKGIIPENYFRDKTVVGILTSRGCPFKCIYCQFSSLTDHKVHFHSVDRVLSEIEWIRNSVLQFHPEKEDVMIMIYDETLTLSRKRIELLCRRLIRKNFNPPVKLWIDTRADYVDEALIALLKAAGAKKINFGLESAVPKILKKIGKVTANRNRKENDVKAEKRFLNQIQTAVKWGKAQELFTSVSMIVGLPTETMDDARQTLQFVRDLDVDLYYHNFLNVLEGTELEKNAKTLGYEWDIYPEGYMGKYGHRYTKAPIPTRSLAPLKNAMVFQRDRKRFGVLLRGWSYASKCTPLRNEQMKYKPFVLGLETCPSNPDFKRHFLPEYAGLSTTLFCPEGLSISGTEYSQILQNLPLKNALFHVVPARENSLKRIKGIEEADQSTPYYLPLKDLGSFQNPDNGRRVFVAINDREDFECLARFLRNFKKKNGKNLSYSQAELLDFDLFESCRWLRWFGATCPAALLTHIFCDQHQGLTPCVHFPVISRVSDKLQLESFREQTEWRIRQKTDERGCQQCPVNSKCPQCIAPFPLTDDEYCEFQKSYLTAGI